MNTLKNLNSIAIFIPIFLILFGLINPLGFYLAAYSTVITGLLQVTIALIALYKNKKNIYIIIYLLHVVLFFLLWHYNENINYIDSLTWLLLFTPLFLCIYLSIIIYTQKETK